MSSTSSASYQRALSSLYALQFFGIKLGLKNVRGLLRSIGDPHRTFRVIHIAGTNGKGSTASMLAAILTEAGFRTGLYTSPHLVDFRERMRIDGREIPKRSVVQWTRRVLPEVRRRHATFFEAVTTIAFGWFSEENIDIAVVETGLGGRLDATNVVHPILSVITSIGLEHTAVLGPTLSSVAREKAGIVKLRVPCVCGVLPKQAELTIRRFAKVRQARIHRSTAHRVRIRRTSLAGSALDVEGPSGRWKDLSVNLAGRFQIANLKTVLSAIAELRNGGITIPDVAIRHGLAKVGPRSGLRGRLNVVRQHPTVVVDVAHNPSAFRSLAHALNDIRWKPNVAVVGFAADKDIRSIGRVLRSIAHRIVAVAAHTHRSRSAADTASILRKLGMRVTIGSSVAGGMSLAMRIAGRKGRVLITGSHFVAGEAVAHLERRPYLTISQ